MKVTQREAYVFEVDENGSIGMDFTSITQGDVPPWAEFDEYVERRRAEREQMYETEYVAHFTDREYDAQIRVDHPDD